MVGFVRYFVFGVLNLPAKLLLPISLSAASPRLVYQFPPGVFVENIACRSNGQLLLSILSEPVLYSIDPTAATPTPKVVHRFPNVNGMSGIAETETADVFAINAGIWNLTSFQGKKGSFSVWSVDFRSDPPKVKMIAPVPDTSNLDGLANIKGSPNTLLLADSQLGAVWALDTKSGKSRVAIEDPSLKPGKEFPLGINGISTNGKHLYFTNSGQKSYGRIPIHPNGSTAGKGEKISTLIEPAFEAFDDFGFDEEGNALIATHPNGVFKVTTSGTQSILSASSLLLQPTSAMLGRGSSREQRTLYITTGGQPKVSTIWGATSDGKAQGGQLYAIDNYRSSRFEKWVSRFQQVL